MEQSDNNPQVIISNVISSNGNDKDSWSELLCNITSYSQNSLQETVSILSKNLINKENINITLDIIDFLINYGIPEIIELIAKREFLANILFLLKNKSKSSVEIQKKIIFLTQKWHQKFENSENENLKGFSNNYNSLKKGGIIFPPPSYSVKTYNNYISDDEAKNYQMKANAIKKIANEAEQIKQSMNYANPFSNFEENENIENNNNIEPPINNIDNNNIESPINDIENNNNNIESQINNIENNNNNIEPIFNINNIDNNENDKFAQKKEKKDDLDDRNPYMQYGDSGGIYNYKLNDENSKTFTNQGTDDKNYNNFNNNKKINNYNNNMNQQNEQSSKYPSFPSQMINNMNNNYNNNNQKNNPYFVRNKTMNTPSNNYYNNINNNNNNFNRNNNNFNNTYNNNFNKNQFNNNKTNNYPAAPNNSSIDTHSYKRILGNRLLQLNGWINEGKYSFNSGKLKQGIQEILNEIQNCNSMMKTCQQCGDRMGYDILKNMRKDIEQTCSRYEALMTDKIVEPFWSSFSGNTRQYCFNTNNMFGIHEDYSGMGNFDNYYKSSGLGSNQQYQSSGTFKKKESIGDKLSDFGNSVKDGFMFVGGKIKGAAVSGYNFVKDKIND